MNTPNSQNNTNKAHKIFKIVFLSFVGAGILLTLIAFSIYGFNFNRVWADITNEANFELVELKNEKLEGATAFDIRVDNATITIQTSATGEFGFKYNFDTESSKVERAEVVDGTFIFVKTQTFSFVSVLRPLSLGENRVTLTVPFDFDGQITAFSKNGQINASNLNNLGMIKAETDNGRLEISNSTIAFVETKTQNGQIRLNNVTAQAINATTINGTINFSSVTANRAEMKNQNGQNRVSGSTINHLVATVSNGTNNIELRGRTGDYFISMSTRNGTSRLNNNSFSGQRGLENRDNLSVTLSSHNGSNRLTFI